MFSGCSGSYFIPVLHFGLFWFLFYSSKIAFLQENTNYEKNVGLRERERSLGRRENESDTERVKAKHKSLGTGN